MNEYMMKLINGMNRDYNRKGLWDSGLVTIHDPKIIVDIQCINKIKRLDKIMDSKEFSVLFKGQWTKKGFVVLGDTHIVPKQKVDFAHVRYDETLTKYRSDGYNVVMHRHPNGLRSFSATDYEFINTNFPCSLLFVDNKIRKATIRSNIDENTRIIADINEPSIYETENYIKNQV